MKELPVRKKIRLVNYDYSNTGYYFITICIKDKHELLGSIANHPHGLIQLSEYGCITESTIHEIPEHYHGIFIDQYVIMPNHIHMILILNRGESIPPTVSTIIQQLKRQISKKIGFSLWQKSYHDHIIRDEPEYLRICQYIDENPAQWAQDEYNPENVGLQS